MALLTDFNLHTKQQETTFIRDRLNQSDKQKLQQYCIQFGKIDMLKFLHLECGLDFNNMSALQLAAKHGHVHILRCIREVINFTADDFCIENNNQDFQKIIRNAAEYGHCLHSKEVYYIH